LTISVSDTGMGIPPEKIAAIFEKFTQADGTVSRRYGGTGLGLTITKMLAGLQNGKVWVESEVGCGSTFYVTLEFESSDAPLPEREQPAEPPVLSNPYTTEQAPYILVVEDNMVNQKVIATILRKKGFRVRIASHGGEALEALGLEDFALILMDVQMPVLDGLETTRLIRRDPKWVSIPILAMTAHALHGDREKCLQAGMDSYISKPVNPGHLISTIQAFLTTGSKRASALMISDGRPAPIDEALAERLLDHSPQLMKSMVSLFLELAPERIQKLQSAAILKDADTLRRQAEELKKAAERIAATGIANCAGEIERNATAGDPESAIVRLERLESEIARLHTHAQP
jgi:CheY-like chemotaxis protein/HPt (histidine-containing phosphotransfer) domain-containing protein